MMKGLGAVLPLLWAGFDAHSPYIPAESIRRSVQEYHMPASEPLRNPLHNTATDTHVHTQRRVLSQAGHYNQDGVGRGLGTTNVSSFRPLRIVAYFDTTNIHASADHAKFLREDLVPAALTYWGGILSVVPVVGNLKLDRHCPYVFSPSGVCNEVEPTSICGNGADDPVSILHTLISCAHKLQSAHNPTSAC
jgi:hypothetical protein